MLPSVRNAAKHLYCRAAFPTAEPVQAICALTSLRDLLQPLLSSSNPHTCAYTSGSAQIRAFSSARKSHTAGLRSGGPEQPCQRSRGQMLASSGNVSDAEVPRMAGSVQQGIPGSSLHTSSAAAAAAASAAPDTAAAAEESSSVMVAVPPGRVQNTPPPPWTPTQQLKKRNFLPRRMGHLMQVCRLQLLIIFMYHQAF